jgi:pyrimidine-nucleoside phosphorylase
MKSTKELLRFKRDGHHLSAEDIHRFINGVVGGTVSPAQVGAFCMASCVRGLDPEETAALTMSMTHSGKVLRRSDTGRRRIDKHSTGGVGDKVSLLLAPLAASCGIDVPMISGRGLGHTGGTLDKLESVPGFSIAMTEQEMDHCLTVNGLFMAGQTVDLAPADRILYAIRDVTGTVENIGLITASILSKKFAESLDGLVMDMKVGSAAFMQTLDQARTLAESMKSVCDSVGIPVRFVFTRMDEPLGYAVGNWLEIAEAEHALATSAQRSLGEVTIELTAHMVHVAGLETTIEDSRRRVVRAWKDGTAHQQFHRMIAQQGGTWSDAVTMYAMQTPLVIESATSGWIDHIDARAVADAVLQAGGGRQREDDVIDPSAGVVFHCERGSEVAAGDPLVSVYARDAARRDELAAAMRSIIQTKTAPVERKPSMIIEVW